MTASLPERILHEVVFTDEAVLGAASSAIRDETIDAETPSRKNTSEHSKIQKSKWLSNICVTNKNWRVPKSQNTTS